MANKFSTIVDVKFAKKDYIKEVISITGSVISGTYPEPGVAGSNIFRPDRRMYQTVKDYAYLSQSANQIFDITWGVRSGGEFATNVVSGTEYDSQAKFNIYDQMAALILGYDQTGSVRVFDVSGNFNSVNAASVMDAPVFINLSRLVNKDEIAKGTFNLIIDTGSWSDPQSFTSTNRATITDSGTSDLENGLRVLKKTSDGSYVGILDRYRGIAVIQLSSSVVKTMISELPVNNYFVSSSTVGRQWEFGASVHSGTIDELSTALRHRIYNMQISNLTQLNTTAYTIKVGPDEFNYSSNPSYIDEKGQIKIKKTEAGILDSSNPAYAYVTGVGLYSSDGELLAVAKLSQPVKKIEGSDFNLSVKLTY